MSKVYDEYQRRMELAMALMNAAEVDPKAVAQVAIGSLAVAPITEEAFFVGLTGMVEAATQLQKKWEAEAREAQVECNCRSCQLQRAAEGGPVVVEYATEEEAKRLLAQYGEAY